MTKQELYALAVGSINFHDAEEVIPAKCLDEFFSQNVVIPKGENRHPFADVLHEWIEGAKIVASEDEKHFHDVASAKNKLSGKYYIKKCIKLQEPIYEWQWSYTFLNGIVTITNEFMTDDEIHKYGTPFVKIEETKRVRQ